MLIANNYRSKEHCLEIGVDLKYLKEFLKKLSILAITNLQIALSQNDQFKRHNAD